MSLRRFQFGLRGLFALMLIAAVGSLLYSWDASVFWQALFAVLAANTLGVGLGWFVTHILRLPNDGSLEEGDVPETSTDGSQIRSL